MRRFDMSTRILYGHEIPWPKESETGDYVFYADHIAALEAAEITNAAMSLELDKLRKRVAELEKYEALEPLLESLVDYCNNVSLCCIDEVIAATAGLERLYRARKAAAPKEEV